MRDLTQYAFANAKIRAMLSYLLGPAQLSSLVEAADIEELKEKLKNTAYGDVIASLGTDTCELAEVEKALARYDVAVLRKIYFTLNSSSLKKFISLFLQRYELEQLKIALRIWHRKLAVAVEEYVLAEKIVFNIDYKKIILCQSIEEVIILLDDTPYKRPLLKAREKFKTHNAAFYLEVALDVDYYERLLACTEKFSSRDRVVARKLIGIEVDIENISWFIRLRKYYSVGMGDILEWVIPGGDKIDIERIRSFYTSDGLGQVVASIALGPYIKIKELMDENAALVESFLYEVLSREVKRTLAGFPFTIGTILGYLILKHRETKNLISLFYAKSYQMKKEDIASLLQIPA